MNIDYTGIFNFIWHYPGSLACRGCGELMSSYDVVGEDVVGAFEVGDGAGDSVYIKNRRI